MDWITNNLDLAGVAALILAFVAVWKSWRGEPTSKADAAKTWQEMVDKCARVQQELQGEINEMCDRLDDLETELAEYREGVDKLITQLEENKITPVWRPKMRSHKRRKHG